MYNVLCTILYCYWCQPDKLSRFSHSTETTQRIDQHEVSLLNENEPTPIFSCFVVSKICPQMIMTLYWHYWNTGERLVRHHYNIHLWYHPREIPFHRMNASIVMTFSCRCIKSLFGPEQWDQYIGELVAFYPLLRLWSTMCSHWGLNTSTDSCKSFW